MLSIRNVTQSIQTRLAGIFTNPPNNPDTNQPYLSTKFNVYGEDSYHNPDFTPVAPYIYLLMSRVPPERTRLPTLMIEFGDLTNSSFEIGNRRGAVQVCLVHVFGRTRGERDELAGLIRDVLTNYIALPIYDFTPGTPSPVLKWTSQIENINVSYQSVAPDIGLEGTLNNWDIVSFLYQLNQ